MTQTHDTTEDQRRLTLDEFIRSLNSGGGKLSVSICKAFRNFSPSHEHLAKYYDCTIRYSYYMDTREMRTYFNEDSDSGQGSADTGPPTLASLLNALALGARGYEDAKNFEEWAAWCGYNTHSCSAEQMYRFEGEQADKLSRLLGREHYEQLLFNVESL